MSGSARVREVGKGPAPRGHGTLTFELQEIGRAFVNPFHRWEARVVDPPDHWPRAVCSKWHDRKGDAVRLLAEALEAHLKRKVRYKIVELERYLPKVGNLP